MPYIVSSQMLIEGDDYELEPDAALARFTGDSEARDTQTGDAESLQVVPSQRARCGWDTRYPGNPQRRLHVL
jgi:hypothetical protein